MLDLKIQGGRIADGSGGAAYWGDVGIRQGRIVELGQVAETARETIDAAGKVVAPGFVDVHTHYDAQVFWDPTLSPSSFHGVTTIFGGFCGFSIAPLSKESSAYIMPMLARVEGMPLESLAAGVPWDWTSFADYLGRFDGTLAINAGFLAGHSAIRSLVMGPRSVGSRATPPEIEKMRDVLRECIRGGALGFSTSLSPTHNDPDGNPVPSRHASLEEVLALFSVVSEFEGTVAEMAVSGDFSPDTYETLTKVSLAAQRPVNWNLLVLQNMRPGERTRVNRQLGASDYAHERGAEVVALTVPQTVQVRINLQNGVIFETIPGWAAFFKLSIPERIERLHDPDYLAQLRAGAASMQGELALVADWPNMQVAEVFSERNKRYAGRLIGAIAAEEGESSFDVLVKIALADELRTMFIPQCTDDVPEVFRERAKLWDDRRTVIGGSDAGAHLDMIDTFSAPTALLASGVRKHGVISLEQAVHQLTQKPAELMGLTDRGLLKVGYHADIVIFDADSVGPAPVHTRRDLPGSHPRLFADAQGIDRVIVNGCEVIRHGQYLGRPAGTLLRPGRDTYTVPINSRASARSTVGE
jgi:N-acyl-D-aspartate/D-glutamate deacylase